MVSGEVWHDRQKGPPAVLCQALHPHNLTCKDSAGFATLFGATTVTGLADPGAKRKIPPWMAGHYGTAAGLIRLAGQRGFFLIEQRAILVSHLALPYACGHGAAEHGVASHPLSRRARADHVAGRGHLAQRTRSESRHPVTCGSLLQHAHRVTGLRLPSFSAGQYCGIDALAAIVPVRDKLGLGRLGGRHLAHALLGGPGRQREHPVLVEAEVLREAPEDTGREPVIVPVASARGHLFPPPSFGSYADIMRLRLSLSPCPLSA
jgi:hypothetical protein